MKRKEKLSRITFDVKVATSTTHKILKTFAFVNFLAIVWKFWVNFVPYRKIKGRNDANDSQRIPALHKSVARPFTWVDVSGEHPGEADGVIANVHVLLNLADALGYDFTHFHADQLAQRFDFLPEGFADLAYDFTPLRRCNLSPNLPCFLSLYDAFFIVLFCASCYLGDWFSVGRA